MPISRREILSSALCYSSVAAVSMAMQPLAIAGGAGGGATELTQIRNEIQLLAVNASTAANLVKTALMLENQIRDLLANPFGALFGSEVGGLVGDIGKLMDAGASVGGSLAQLNNRLKTKYDTPFGKSFAQNFKDWSSSSQDTLTGAMKSAGMVRDHYKTSESAIRTLYDKASSIDGSVVGLQTVSAIGVEQVKSMQALTDLTASFQIATGDFMKQSLAKDEHTMKINNDRANASFGLMNEAKNMPLTGKNSKYNFKFHKSN